MVVNLKYMPCLNYTSNLNISIFLKIILIFFLNRRDFIIFQQPNTQGIDVTLNGFKDKVC
jgi:hypothetical protein